MEEVITINIKTAMGRLHSELVRLECNFDDWVGEGSCGEWESEFYGIDREAYACLRGCFEALNPTITGCTTSTGLRNSYT